MKPKVVEITDIINQDQLAKYVGRLWDLWKAQRVKWAEAKDELRQYLFATDTTQTSNAQLPWKNSTTMPKLCQIRDNLHANYMAALFPNEDWFKWVGGNQESETWQKAKVITAYMKNKLNASGFRTEVSKLVLDYIDYGNAFAEVVYVNELHTDETGATQIIYQGPQLRRISPFDIVFDVTAANFKEAPKVTRSLMTLGQFKKLANTQLGTSWAQEAFDMVFETRKRLSGFKREELKYDSFSVDGFASPLDYFNSGMCEVLEFEGDLYIQETGELLENRQIIVVDRSFVLVNRPYTSWLGRSNKEHVGWRTRPDNLMAMGPLDNLVGLQYRIDHLENLKADVFDQIATPVVYQKGYVEEWEWGPNQRIFGDVESDVKVLAPDTTALQADLQIAQLLNYMEELAGAPKQAMGIRTPGEKTAYEVQSLDNAAGRIFQNKVSHFEEVFLEPILNQMLAVSVKYLNTPDVVRVLDDDLGVVDFMTITQDDIKASGKLVPMGARHFARKAQIVQNLTNLSNSAIYQDPAVNVHISGKRMAQLITELLDVSRFDLVQDNIRVVEGMETTRLQTIAQTQLAEEQATGAVMAEDQARQTQMQEEQLIAEDINESQA
jgi:hypothetical protein